MDTRRSGERVVVGGRTSASARLCDAAARAGLTVAAVCSDTMTLVEAVERERPVLCLLDRQLSGGGLSAVAAVSRPRPAPKVLVVGGCESPAEARALRLAGADSCLPADIDITSLADAVRSLVQTGRR